LKKKLVSKTDKIILVVGMAEIVASEIQGWLRKYPPLSPEEEQTLFRRYGLAMSVLSKAFVAEVKERFGKSLRTKGINEPLASYLRYASQRLRIPYEEVWKLFWQCKNKLTGEELALVCEGERIREKLFNHNLRLVVAVLSKFPKFAGMQFEDLFYEGVLGLGKAIDHYDLSEGTKFSTIAIWWIHQEVGRKLLKYSSEHGGIQIPTRLIERWSRLRKYLAENGIEINELSEDEFVSILNQLNFPREAYELVASCSVISIEQPVEDEPTADDRDLVLREVIEDMEDRDIETFISKNLRRKILFKVLDDLSERERSAILLYFGFEGDCAGNFSAVGRALGISRQRAMQVVKNALKKLREHPLVRELLEI
jgi:RNA polymerase primary sigma factor